MKLYLKFINPALAFLVFCWCTYSASREDPKKQIELANIIGGGIPSYFFAKGIFCALAIFLLGKILEELKYGVRNGIIK
jgi:hypothetical protein